RLRNDIVPASNWKNRPADGFPLPASSRRRLPSDSETAFFQERSSCKPCNRLQCPECALASAIQESMYKFGGRQPGLTPLPAVVLGCIPSVWGQLPVCHFARGQTIADRLPSLKRLETAPRRLEPHRMRRNIGIELGELCPSSIRPARARRF